MKYFFILMLSLKGCDIDHLTDYQSALQFAARSDVDVIVVALTENPATEWFGDINDLSLHPAQFDYVRLLHDVGKPLIFVLALGRPRLILPVVDMAQAIVMV